MTEDIVTTETFAELCEAMGADFAAELLDTFLSEGPTMLEALKTAVAEEDADAYRRAAHSMKSNAEIFGATALADLSRQMELTSLSDVPPRSLLSRITDHYLQIMANQAPIGFEAMTKAGVVLSVHRFRSRHVGIISPAGVIGN